jgi:hypothetical protein
MPNDDNPSEDKDSTESSSDDDSDKNDAAPVATQQLPEQPRAAGAQSPAAAATAPSPAHLPLNQLGSAEMQKKVKARRERAKGKAPARQLVTEMDLTTSAAKAAAKAQAKKDKDVSKVRRRARCMLSQTSDIGCVSKSERFVFFARTQGLGRYHPAQFYPSSKERARKAGAPSRSSCASSWRRSWRGWSGRQRQPGHRPPRLRWSTRARPVLVCVMPPTTTSFAAATKCVESTRIRADSCGFGGGFLDPHSESVFEGAFFCRAGGFD